MKKVLFSIGDCCKVTFFKTKVLRKCGLVEKRGAGVVGVNKKMGCSNSSSSCRRNKVCNLSRYSGR